MNLLKSLGSTSTTKNVSFSRLMKVAWTLSANASLPPSRPGRICKCSDTVSIWDSWSGLKKATNRGRTPRADSFHDANCGKHKAQVCTITQPHTTLSPCPPSPTSPNLNDHRQRHSPPKNKALNKSSKVPTCGLIPPTCGD